MAKDYSALLSPDPAWPALEETIAASSNGPVVLPATDAKKAVLERLQVSTRSTLGAVAHECGGILVDHGWLRVLGSGSPRLPRAVGAWNEEVGVGMDEALIVADDVIGGVFAINAGALGETLGNVFYFAPDSLEWEDTELGHSDWMGWVLTGDLEQFYADFRWKGWEAEVEALPGDQSIHFWPPAWSDEGKDIDAASRKTVPAAELFAWMFDEAAEAAEDDELQRWGDRRRHLLGGGDRFADAHRVGVQRGEGLGDARTSGRCGQRRSRLRQLGGEDALESRALRADDLLERGQARIDRGARGAVGRRGDVRGHAERQQPGGTDAHALADVVGGAGARALESVAGAGLALSTRHRRGRAHRGDGGRQARGGRAARRRHVGVAWRADGSGNGAAERAGEGAAGQERVLAEIVGGTGEARGEAQGGRDPRETVGHERALVGRPDARCSVGRVGRGVRGSRVAHRSARDRPFARRGSAATDEQREHQTTHADDATAVSCKPIGQD
jgi:hypothetical protein